MTSLLPYIPRLAVDWLATSPQATHRRVEGTMLFVDIAGFTALTEGLAQHGKVGAEEITDVIATVFGELVAVATDHGGDLLKWGGDAVLLYFAEPDSAPRALRCAWLMLELMDRAGRVRTSSGRISLGISIGAHSGTFDLYLLGAGHRELIITGPDASITAEMEAIAAPGEVVMSQQTAARLDEGERGEYRRGGILLRASPPPVSVLCPVGAGPALEVDVTSLLPADTRERLDGTDEAEHRQAAVAFIEFSGVDDLTRTGGSELVAYHLEAIVNAVEAAAERFRVNFHETDIGPDGGKIVLVSGFPVQRGNDAERLIRTVHEVLASHASGSPLRLRAGISAGRVFVFSHQFERAGRRVIAVTGDSVNVAARLMGSAEPGQLLATVAALDRAAPIFDVTPLAPIAVKGRSEPVRAAIVTGPIATVPNRASDDSLFVGRETELQVILESARSAVRERGAALNVVGPAGIGKSRLVDEAVTRSSLTCFRVVCEEYSRAPYTSMRRVFRWLLDVADGASQEVALEQLREKVRNQAPTLEANLATLTNLLDIRIPSTRETADIDPRFRRTVLEHTAVQLLRASVTVPVALVVEDIHVIDDASASLLARIASEAATLPLLVLLTSRPETETDSGLVAVAKIELAPLEADAAVQLAIAETENAPLSSAQFSSVVERAEGNPLFLRQLARAATLPGGLEELPESLEPLLAADIDRLSSRDRRVLRALSVLGTYVDASQVDAVLGDDLADEATWSSLGNFLAPTATGWQFTHDLVRVAAYEGLPFRRRRELHTRVATALEGAGEPDELADRLSLHWLRAENWDRAWHYARLAGDQARSLWANADAATFYTRAVEASRHFALSATEVLSVAEALGDVSELSGLYPHARDAYRRARRLARDPVDRARLTRKLGNLHEHEGRYAAALSSYTRARKMLPVDHPQIGPRSNANAERTMLDVASAGSLLRSGRFRRALAFAVDAERGARGPGDEAALASALMLQHLALVYLGEHRDDLANRALELHEASGNLVGVGNVLNNLGVSAQSRGDWPASTSYYERSLEMRHRSGDVVGVATQENNLGENFVQQGRFEEARVLLESAHRSWAAASYAMGVAVARGNLGLLLTREGKVQQGRTLVESALEEFQRLHSSYAVVTDVRLAECDLLAGDFRAAVTALRRIRRTLGADDASLNLSALRLEATAGALAVLAGEGDLGTDWETTLATVMQQARDFGEGFELAMALAARAAVNVRLSGRSGTDLAGTVADQREADEIFASLGVQRAVLTWSERATGEPLFATGGRVT